MKSVSFLLKKEAALFEDVLSGSSTTDEDDDAALLDVLLIVLSKVLFTAELSSATLILTPLAFVPVSVNIILMVYSAVSSAVTVYSRLPPLPTSASRALIQPIASKEPTVVPLVIPKSASDIAYVVELNAVLEPIDMLLPA